jgi:hypothetical protein
VGVELRRMERQETQHSHVPPILRISTAISSNGP